MLSVRSIWVLPLLLAATAWSQDTTPAANGIASPSALSVLEQTARQKTADWQRMAQGLDAAILQLLPCDPKATTSIMDVSRASDMRSAAILAYLEEAGKQAALQTAAAKRNLDSIQPLAAEFAEDKVDLAQEQAGLNGQIAALTAASGGSSPKPAFAAPQAELQKIAALEKQRADSVDSGVAHATPTAMAIQDLIVRLQAHENAIKETRAAFETEGERWSAYYNARLLRAQTECAATKGVLGGPAPAPKPQGKQK